MSQPAPKTAQVPDTRWFRTSVFLPCMGAVFFCSGFSSLIYEVVWMRRLALFFGSDVYSAAFTLSAFMGGLALGSLSAARYADRLKRPLLWYGFLEISIGLYALFFPNFLNLFSHQYQAVYRGYFDTAPWRYHAFRIAVASATLIVPTTLMGATLPLVVKRFARAGGIGRHSGFFYSINTCGALAGVLGVGFILLPALGVNASTEIACVVNLVIGLAAIVLHFVPLKNAPDEREAASLKIAPVFDSATVKTTLAAIALSGLAALALEVVWMRILTQSFSATVYSFSIMLACFLFGIFFGSHRASRLVDQSDSPVRLFGMLELGLGLGVALLGVLTYLVPIFFSNLLSLLTAASRGNFGVACTIAQFVVSGFLIIPPTVLMGATFPVAARVCTPALARVGRGIGGVYAANTAGGIVGALLGGMVLIPLLGTRLSLLAVAAIFTGAGLLLLRRSSLTGWAHLKDPAAAAVLLFASLSAIVTLLLPRQIITNFYYAGRDKAQSIYHGEGIAHNVDILKTPEGVTIMQVNGTLEADTTYAQRRHFILKAHLPLLLHPHPESVAVIGLGLGITLAAIDRNPEVRNIEVIELTREMVKAQQYLENISGGVLRSPKVALRIDDGRNFMAMTDRTFDMITADPIHPRVTGVGYLYTREYYQSIQRRLKPGGVVCQWMPMYRISKTSFDAAFRTFASVFPNASFWYVRGHGLFVATQNPFQIDFRDLTRRMANPVVTKDLDSIGIHNPAELLAHMLMGPEQISRYLAGLPGATLNTDDDAYLEYHTPFEFLESTKAIVSGLIPFAAPDMRDIQNASPEEIEQILKAWGEREKRLLPELDADIG